MKISELQKRLEELKKEHGNLSVLLCDADTNWLYILEPPHINYEHSSTWPEGYIEIGIQYEHKQHEE